MENHMSIKETVEKEETIFDCMEWMENKIRDTVAYMREKMQQEFNRPGADNNYIEGYCDALLDLMDELEIKRG